jgi:hypothetical protein
LRFELLLSCLKLLYLLPLLLNDPPLLLLLLTGRRCRSADGDSPAHTH